MAHDALHRFLETQRSSLPSVDGSTSLMTSEFLISNSQLTGPIARQVKMALEQAQASAAAPKQQAPVLQFSLEDDRHAFPDTDNTVLDEDVIDTTGFASFMKELEARQTISTLGSMSHATLAPDDDTAGSRSWHATRNNGVPPNFKLGSSGRRSGDAWTRS